MPYDPADKDEGIYSKETRKELLHRLTGKQVFVYTSMGMLPKFSIKSILQYDGDGNYSVSVPSPFFGEAVVFFLEGNVIKIEENEIKISFL